MQTLLIVFHLFLALALIGLILIQHGKGADAGAAFGSGASATVFGAQGSASFLTRATAGLATLFFLTSITMAYFSTQSEEPAGVMDAMQPPAVEIPGENARSRVVPSDSDVPVVPSATPAPSEVPRVDNKE